jgi:TolB-like protein/Flp pilus assembly protein TadD
VGRLAAESGGRIIDWAGDGCFLTFETPSGAVLFALRLQQAHAEEPDLPRVRAGIHMGEVDELHGTDGDIEGLAVDLASRIAGLAGPVQILMSASVADSARPRLGRDALSRPICWRTHGRYRLKGFDEALEIREAGIDGVAPFAKPVASDKAAALPSAGSVAGRPWVIPVAIASVVLVVAAVVYLLRSPPLDRTTVARPAESHADGVQAPGGATPIIPSLADRPAIAVLPLDNLSPDPAQAFFADGLAEDLITRLSTWRSFPVIARNSSFKYRGGNLDLKKVGAELGARYLVEGSVRRADHRIRVTAQLIDASSGEHVWGEAYDRDVKDVFAVQDEISSTIAASIASDVNRVESERASQRGTENLEAWSLYEMGLAAGLRMRREHNAEARRLAGRAVALDPHFAAALALLSQTHAWDVVYGWSEAPEQSLAAALETALRAVELDPRDPLAHAALGAAYLLKGDVRAGIDSTRRGVELNPSMPEAWLWHGWAQLVSGDPEGSIASNLTAQRLNPQGEAVSPAWDNMAVAYWEMGRYEASLDAARHLIAARPDYWYGPVDLALSEVALGHVDEARSAIADARRLQPELSIAMIQHSFGVARPEVDARRNAALRQAGLE